MPSDAPSRRLSSSPRISTPPPLVKRARRTYGRPKAISDADTSFEAANTSISSRDESVHSTPYTDNDDLPPNSDAFDASNTSGYSAMVDDDDDEDEGDSGPPKWSWRQGLLDIDNQYDNDNAASSITAPEPPHGSPLHDASRPASPLSTTAANLKGNGATQPTIETSRAPPLARPSSSRTTSTVANRLDALALQSERADLPSSPPRSSPYNILGTPPARSSTTPPSSLEPEQKQTKRRLKRVVSPLSEASEEEARHSDMPKAKPQRKKVTTSRAGRVKAPTKKEQREMLKTTARITAEQTVAIDRAPAVRFSIDDIRKRLDTSSIEVQSPPLLPSSDPIQTSSPRMERAPFERSSAFDEAFVPTGLLAAGPSRLSLAAGYGSGSEESEADLPDVTMLLAEDRNKREDEARRDQLLETKRRLLQQQPQPAYDSDSDMEILPDDTDAKKPAARKGSKPRVSLTRQKQLALAGASMKGKERSLLQVDREDAVKVMREAAVSSFARSTEGKRKEPVRIRPGDLNKKLLLDANTQAAVIARRKEEEWQRRGGKLKEEAARPQTKNPGDILREIVARRNAQREDGRAMDPEDSDDDDDWRPSDDKPLDLGSGEEDDQEDDENIQPFGSPVRTDRSAGHADDEDDEDENVPAPRRRSGRPRPRANVVVESDAEDDRTDADIEGASIPMARQLLRDTSFARPSHSPGGESRVSALLTTRSSMSSLGGEPTDEGGTDKENDVRLSFDQGDDKENTVVATQSPSFTLRLQRSASGFGSFMRSPEAHGLQEDVRSPLREIAADDGPDDPFAIEPLPVARRLDFGTPSRPPRSGFVLKGRSRSASPTPIGLPLAPLGGGGFSQFVTQVKGAGGDGFAKLRPQPSDDIELSLVPATLQPALEISNTLRQRADAIFEQQQELVAQGDMPPAESPQREMFVNAHGFLTQTRPQYTSPLQLETPSGMLRTMSPSRTGSTLVPSNPSTTRKPLQAIPSSDSIGSPEPRPLGRIRRGPVAQPLPALHFSPTPIKPRNAFDVLGASPVARHTKKKLGRSEFVEGEAAESDDEARMGFGIRRAASDDEEDSDDEEADKTLLDMVDDRDMDQKELAEQAVLEKHREMEALDDAAVEKLHQDAVQGKLRAKRRDRGVGFDDSDSDEDGPTRVRPLKKARKNDTIEALARSEETRAFAEAYNPVDDDDDRQFEHLNEDSMDILDDVEREGDENEDGEDAPRIVSAEQLQEELRAAARNQTFEKALDPEDVEWVERKLWDAQDPIDEEPRVREVERRKPLPTHRGRFNDDNFPSRRATGGKDDDDDQDPDRKRMRQWHKNEMSTRTGGLPGRTTGSSGSAVTGHGKAKTVNAGPSKALTRSATASARAAEGKQPAKVTRAQSSALAALPSRKAKFGS